MQFSLVKSDNLAYKAISQCAVSKVAYCVGARVRGLVIIVFHEHTGARRISEGSIMERLEDD